MAGPQQPRHQRGAPASQGGKWRSEAMPEPAVALPAAGSAPAEPADVVVTDRGRDVTGYQVGDVIVVPEPVPSLSGRRPGRPHFELIHAPTGRVLSSDDTVPNHGSIKQAIDYARVLTHDGALSPAGWDDVATHRLADRTHTYRWLAGRNRYDDEHGDEIDAGIRDFWRANPLRRDPSLTLRRAPEPADAATLLELLTDRYGLPTDDHDPDPIVRTV